MRSGQVAVLNIHKGATLTLLVRHAANGGAADGGTGPAYDANTRTYTAEKAGVPGAGGAGAGAGLRIEPNATLIVTGAGRLVAIGGNGGAGGAGCAGGAAYAGFDYFPFFKDEEMTYGGDRRRRRGRRFGLHGLE